RRVDESVQLAQTLAADPLLAYPSSGQETRDVRLKYYHRLSPILEDLTLLDMNGEVLASSRNAYTGKWTDSNAFLRASQGSIAISTPVLADGSPTLSFITAAPVSYQETGAWAVLAIQLPLFYFTDQLDSMQIGATGRAFLLEPGGARLEPGVMDGPLAPWSAPAAAQVMARTDGVLQGQDKGTALVYAIASIPLNNGEDVYRVVLQAPASEAYADLQRISRLFLIVGAGLVALVTLGAAVVAGLITKPVQQITRGARELSRGNLDYRVHVRDRTELGELASTFNSMAADLESRMAELQDSRRRLVSVQEGVRREIAERLHGPVQTQLLVLWHSLGEADRLLEEGQREEAAALIRQARDGLQQMQDREIRGLSHRLHPSIVRMGLSPAMRSLCERFGKLAPVTFSPDDQLVASEKEDPNLLPGDLRLVLYRIAEEALNNVVKHSGATEARVSLTYSPHERVGLTVEDNGRGLAAEDAKDGLGLLSMRDYAESQGGSCQVEGRSGGGTVVRVSLPLGGPG
ncbi:MAG: HAMP domain-containing protein, partial [Chloroflexota bacterium]|nr:HAMP domain-containing protein [Chloroflexota bacterium]